MKIGSYVGTGTDQSIEIGFVPRLIDITCRSSASPAVSWNSLQLPNSAHAKCGAFTVTSVWANGVNAYAGNTTHAPGITVGSWYLINKSGLIYDYRAFKSTEVDQ
jgi:hypothetical protein